MVVAPEKIEEVEGRPARQRPTQHEEETVGSTMNTVHKGNTHISNEKLLAMGGTVAGAAFLGGAFGGALGAALGAIAGFGMAFYTAKLKGKEGARRG